MRGSNMALQAGTRLGSYEVLSPIGAGGMGEVYLARDTRLGREVAIKVLPHSISTDPVARQRLQREARAVAALSHPHICPLFDVGCADERDYLVMEYLRGETLGARLRRGRLGLREALAVALQMASGLAAAHRAGIVHRDLKPGNVILTETGARLLDFGLARQTEEVSLETTTGGNPLEPLTGSGTIVGTVPYMAPEQIEGRPADARTDIFSFGAVLYEIVTGRRAFDAPTLAALMGSIVRDDPPSLTTVDPRLPPGLDRLIRRCLAKDPADRWASMAEIEARLEALQDVTSDVYSTAAPDGERVSTSNDSAPRTDGRPAGRGRRGIISAVAAVACIAVAFAFLLISRHASLRGPSGANASTQRSLTRLTFGDLDESATFSPDGRFIAYDSNGDLRVRPTAGGNPVQITHAAAYEGFPDWAPDGTSIAFERSGEGIFAVSPLGGQERHISSFGRIPTWSPDGTQLLFVTEPFSSAIRLFLAARDQPPERILSAFLEGGYWQVPSWHPDGRITIAGRHRTDGLGIYTISVRTGRSVKTAIPSELLVDSNIDPERVYVLNWADTAKLLYVAIASRDGILNIWRLRVSPELQITALDRLTTGPGADWWPRISRDGKKLLFTVITGDSRLWSFPFVRSSGDAVGTGQPLSEEDGEVNWATLSRDGRRLAYYYQPLNSQVRQSELRVSSRPFTEPPERVPADRYVRMASAWSHTSDRLAVQAAEVSSTGVVTGNVLIVRDRSGSERVIGRCQSASQAAPCSLMPVDWTPDDTAILVTSRLGQERRSQLGVWPVSVETSSVSPAKILVADADWNISQGGYSPDARWLAFAYGRDFRDESGIAVVPATGDVPRSSWRAIASGFEAAGNPSWSADGRYLYFTSPRGSLFMNVWRVEVMPSTGGQAGSPTPVTAFNSVSQFLVNRSYYPRMAVAADRLIIPMNSQKATVWLLDNVDN
jgi:serine/threonine protein kinase/Tol biopolymer transport system component